MWHFDGTRMPRHISSNNARGSYDISSNNSDVSLRVGVVVAAYPPTHPSNTNKKVAEYTVNSIYTDKDSVEGGFQYFRVRTASFFGGLSDYLRWAPRITSGAEKYAEGSYVLLMCVNGSQRFSYIVGGIPHPNSTQQDPSDSVFFKWQYNGVAVDITQDGSLTILRRGPTDSYGNVTDHTYSGAIIEMNNDGLFTIGYQDADQAAKTGSASIDFDKQQQMVSIFGNQAIYNITNGKFTVLAQRGTLLKVSDINPYIESYVNGDTYRIAESIKNSALQAALATLTTALTQATAALSVAAGLQLMPIAGAVAAAIPLGAAAASLGQAAVAVVTAQAAISTFEAGSDTYLSLPHKFSN